jgi:hypothetical protein
LGRAGFCLGNELGGCEVDAVRCTKGQGAHDRSGAMHDLFVELDDHEVGPLPIERLNRTLLLGPGQTLISPSAGEGGSGLDVCDT